LARGYDIRFHPSALVWHRRRGSVRAFWRQQLGYGKAEALVDRNHPDKFNSLGHATWRGVIYGPTTVLSGRGRIYSGRFGEAPFQRVYSGQNYFNPLWAAYLVLCLLLPALLNPYLLAIPAAALAALAGTYVWRGLGVARRERLRPIWRSGPLIGLLHLLPPMARALGRLRFRGSYVPLGKRSSSVTLQSSGRRLYLTEGVEKVGRSVFLEGLRDRLRTARLHPEMSSGWEQADVTCNSVLFWRARMVAYEAWGTLYLRLTYRPQVVRLAVPTLAIALVLLMYPFTAAGDMAALLAVLLLDGWIFARKVRRALTEDPKEGVRR
jgi:O-antigen biosynthesis protein